MTNLPVNADLLAILRCPEAVQQPEKYGADPGKLRLFSDCWLICDDNGNKYPIRSGIPVMLIEVGQKYRATAEKDLPVPPPDKD